MNERKQDFLRQCHVDTYRSAKCDVRHGNNCTRVIHVPTGNVAQACGRSQNANLHNCLDELMEGMHE